MKKRPTKKPAEAPGREEIFLIESWTTNFRRDGTIERIHHKPEPRGRAKSRKSA